MEFWKTSKIKYSQFKIKLLLLCSRGYDKNMESKWEQN